MGDVKPTPNSHRYKAGEKPPTEKKVGKVINGTAKTKKKSELEKAKSALVSDEAHGVGSYLIMDVVVPAIKKVIVDIVTDGANMIFFGNTGHGKSRSNRSLPYTSYSSQSSKYESDRFASRSVSGYSHDDIILDSRVDAEEVLMSMGDLIEAYGSVSVADLYDLVGRTSRNYTDNDYGWFNIRNAEPVRVRDGYILKLPRAIPIK